ncbi:MAG: aldehyde ferredoxin oxidoreductase family protein [Anaerolineae bacterium]|jgi:aldehyde:ferredoxin oxidoreductase
MPNGWNGRILHVNLTAGEVKVEKPGKTFYRKYVGGSAMGAYYLLKNTPAGADPLGPDNTLSLMVGPTTGAPFSGQSRVAATARSPQTGLVGDSQAGGFWPAELKSSGFDGVVIHGRAERLVYLWVHDGEAELRDAAHLWGRFTAEVEDRIREEQSDARVEVLQCGPAGERGVRFSALINNSNRANGRTGMGAVMASKNLKAVAVRGHSRPELADREAVKALARWGAENFKDSEVYTMGLHGTADVVLPQDEDGGLPTRNWSSGTFEGVEAISGQRMTETILTNRDTCFACVVRCKREVQVDEGPFAVDPRYGGPEYETIATMGSYCGVSDLEAIARANQLCNMYGMDTISCGATIAWAMDCFEGGLLTADETDGLELRFGNAEAMVAMVERIGAREGLGRVLGEGSARAAAALGVGEDLVVAVKGNELPAHMPQVKRSLALIYAVNPFGADHQSSEHDPSYEWYPQRMAELDLKDPQPSDVLTAEKVRYALYTQLFYSCLDSVPVCQFVFGPAWHLYGPSQLVQAVRAVTGWDVSLWELMKVGERRLNLLRAFNAREGAGRDTDSIPPKLLEPLRGGETDGVVIAEEDVETAKSLYYQMAGWDQDGRPTRAKLEELSLGWVADELDG